MAHSEPEPCQTSTMERFAKINCDVLRVLVPFAQFKKPEKHPWRSVIFSKVALLKVALLHGCF